MDELKEFMEKWVDSPEYRVPFETPVVIDNNICGTVLYRKDEYQIQLFIVAPNTVIPPHRHPNIDTFDIYLGGDIEFWVDDELALAQAEHGSTDDGVSKKMGRNFRVKPDQWHRACIGPKGGSFISIQRWLTGNPTNVGDDWEAKGTELRRNYT